MPPKAPKKTKAEIEAEKAAAEAAAAEEAKKQAEARLQEVKKLKAQALEAEKAAAEGRKENLARLETERQQDEQQLAAQKRKLEELLQAKQRQQQWQRMIRASDNAGGLPSDDEATLQTFLSQVRENEALVRQMVLEGRGSMLAPPQMVGSQLPPHLVAALFGTGGPYSQALVSAAQAGATDDANAGGAGGFGSPGGATGLRSASMFFGAGSPSLKSQSLRMASAFFAGLSSPSSGNGVAIPNSVGVGIRVAGVDAGMGVAPMRPNSSETVNPLTPALTACSELATAAEEVERSLADAIEAGDVKGAAKASAFLSRLRAMMLSRADAASSQLLESAPEYAVELKDGVREIQVFSHVDVLPTPSAEPTIYSDSATSSSSSSSSASSESGGPIVRPFVHPRPVADVLFWANLGPGKAVRTKTVRNGQGLDSVRMTPKEADAASTLSVDLHKSVASLNAALRVTRMDFNFADGAAEYAAAYEARIASAEGLVPEDQWDARGGGGGAGETAGYLGTAGGPGANLRTARAARASVSAAGGPGGAGRRPGGSAGRSGGRYSSSASSRGGVGRGGGLESSAEGKESGADETNEEGGDADDNAADAGDNDGAQGDAEEGGGDGDAEGNEGSTERGGGEKGSVVSERTGGRGGGRGGRGGGGAGGGDDAIGSSPADQEKLILSSSMRPIGGVALIEMLSLQPNATGVKGWLSSRVSPDLTPPLSVHRMAQPSASATSVPSQAIKMKMRIPDHVVVPAEGPLRAVGRYVRLPPNHPLLVMKRSLASGPFSSEAASSAPPGTSSSARGATGTRSGARGGVSGSSSSGAGFVPEDSALPVDLAFAVLHGSHAEVSVAAAVALASSQASSSSSSSSSSSAPVDNAAAIAAATGATTPGGGRASTPAGGRPASASVAGGNPNAATYAATAALTAEANAIEESLKPPTVVDPTIAVVEAAKAGTFDALSPSSAITAATAPLPTLRVPVPTDPVADNSGDVVTALTPYSKQQQQQQGAGDPYAIITPKFQSSGPSALVTPVGFWKAEADSDISEVSYDPFTRVLSFTTSSLGAHALLVPRYADLSYGSWALTPVHGAGSLVSRRVALLKFVAAAGKRLKRRFGALLANASAANAAALQIADGKQGDEDKDNGDDSDDEKKKKKHKKDKKEKKHKKKHHDDDEEEEGKHGDSSGAEEDEAADGNGSDSEEEKKKKKKKDKKEKKDKKDKKKKGKRGDDDDARSSSASSASGSAAVGISVKGGAAGATDDGLGGFTPLTLIDALVESAASASTSSAAAPAASGPGQAPVAFDRDGRTLDHSVDVADLLAPSSASLLPLIEDDGHQRQSEGAVFTSAAAASEARARARAAAAAAASGSRGRSRSRARGGSTARGTSGSPTPGTARGGTANNASYVDDDDDDYDERAGRPGHGADDDEFGPKYLTADSAEGMAAAASAAPGVILRVKTPRFTVSILVDATGNCRLVAPLDVPELRWLIGADPLTGEGAVVVPPGQMLYLLFKSGVNLMPTEQDAHALNFARKKEMAAAATAAAAANAAGGGSGGRSGAPAAVPMHDSQPPVVAVLDSPGGPESGEGVAGGGARVAFDLPEGNATLGGEEGSLSSPFPQGNADDLLGGGDDKDSVAASDIDIDDDPHDPYRGQPAFVPLKCKDRSLEASVYADVARVCGGFAFSVSRWNATPEVGDAKGVLRTKERPLTPLLPADAPALLHASLSFLECSTGLPPLQAAEAYLSYLRTVNGLVAPPKPPTAEGDDVPSTPAAGASAGGSRAGGSRAGAPPIHATVVDGGAIGIDESTAFTGGSTVLGGANPTGPAAEKKKKKVLSEAAAAALLFGAAGLVATLPAQNGPAAASTALVPASSSSAASGAQATTPASSSSPLTSLVIKSLGVSLELPESTPSPAAAAPAPAAASAAGEGSSSSRPTSAAVTTTTAAAPADAASTAIVSVGSLLPAAVTDTRDPTVWRTLAYSREQPAVAPAADAAAAPAGAPLTTVALVSDNEVEARKAWREVVREVREAVYDSAEKEAKKSKTGSSSSSASGMGGDAPQDDPFAGAVPALGDPIPGLASSPPGSPEKAAAAGGSPQHGPDGQPLPSSNELVPLDGGLAGEEGEGADGGGAARLPREPRPRFKGAIEDGATTHVTARIALETVASHEALRMADTAPPLLQHAVHRLLRMVRPLSFTQ